MFGQQASDASAEEKVEAKRSLRTRQALSEQLGTARSKGQSDAALDLPINFLENLLLSSKKELDDRLDIDEVQKARDKLLDALYCKTIRGGTNEEMNAIMIYKGRPLRAQLLHFAVWVSAQLHENSCVARLLPYLSQSDLSAKAKYRLKPGSMDEAWLDAIHVASGLGAVPVMHVLLQHVTQATGIDSAAYVNTPCLVHHVAPPQSDMNMNMNTNEQSNANEWDEDFYMPLHDATNAGNVELSLWLLAHGADACAGNKDGVSPLHFVATRGIEGGLEAESQVTHLVQSLLRHRAGLDVRVPEENPNKQMAGKTPLELAALDGSRFPKHMMHVLAPCLNSLSEPTFFSDIYFLVGLNEDAALEVVRELARRSIRQPELLHNLRFDSQLSGRTDVMAAIFFEAPSAASEMLDLLMVEPHVQDVAKHNVPNKTSFWGLFSNLPMHCTYRPDVVVQDSLLIPSWKFDSQKSFDQQPNIQWHADFIPAVHKSRQSRDHVSSVCVKALLIPNMLDMDIVMAMSRVESQDLPVFGKLSIQGIVHCLWENLFQTAWHFNLFCMVVELACCVHWGLAGLHTLSINTKEGTWAAVSWVIMTSSGFRDILLLIVLLFNWSSKQLGHQSPLMQSMWSLRSSTLATWCLPTLFLSFIQLVFSYSAQSSVQKLTSFPEEELLFLSTNVLFRSWTIIYTCRLHASGLPIHAISNSLVGGATRQIMVITMMIFASFCFAFLIIDSNKKSSWVLSSAYRGLLFGSGMGLDNLGLDVGPGFGDNDVLMTEVSVIGSSFFCVIVLNLIIAVYSSEYNRVQGDIPHHFLHARTIYCLMYFLSGHTLPWKGHHFNRLLLVGAVGTCVLSIAAPIFLFVGVWIPSVVLALAEVAILAALLQCDWFSMEGVAHSKEEHFLWICYRADDSAGNLDDGGLTAENNFRDKLVEVRTHVDTCWAGLRSKAAGVDHKLDELIEILQ
ncbi:hypothetical protein AK812_SmicGene26492 [Symbiodinium microadriaticum]|uniref:Uncharacterized protein n=1 Tax=Symbiodinium microadriaticum TaxID=2951 RepID=A0A1Q9D991_SYMMI|nr:hypothetical protein AK812_SmicGene26492 [Symbiodinium microadriaticum]